MSASSGASGLIRESRRGNREALGKLLDLYASCLRATASQQLRGPVQTRVSASDLVQETCLAASRHFDQFQGATEQEFSSWLQTILKNKTMGALRTHGLAEKRAVAAEQPLNYGDSTLLGDALAADQSTASGRLMRAEEVLVLARALEALLPDQREAVRLHYLHGWTVTQLSAHFGRSTTATAGLLKRGLYALRAKMREERHAEAGE